MGKSWSESFSVATTYSLKISTPFSVMSTGTRTEAGSRDIFTLFDIFKELYGKNVFWL